MHEIEELEKRWKKYKRKKRLTPFIIAFLTLMILITALFWYEKDFVKNKTNTPMQQPKQQEQTDSLQKKIEKTAKPQSLEHNNTAKITPQKKLIMESYEPDINNLTQNKQNQSTQKKVVLQANEIAISEQKTAPQEEKKIQQTAQKPQPKQEKESINLSKSKNSFEPKIYEKRFYETNKIKYALFLANYYYDNNDYQKSYKWAYTINELDPTNEDGWLFFAKSLYKLGKKEDAIKVLRNYLHHYDSTAAKKLLRKIIQGVI